jgi:hypothetical protein
LNDEITKQINENPKEWEKKAREMTKAYAK